MSKQKKPQPDQTPLIKKIRELHPYSIQDKREKLRAMSKEEVIDWALIEFTAKNRAFSFIMDSGNFLAYRDYWLRLIEKEKKDSEINPN